MLQAPRIDVAMALHDATFLRRLQGEGEGPLDKGQWLGLALQGVI